MAGQKKKLRYSEETPWFPKYYIGWIGIGNCDQETSTIYHLKKSVNRVKILKKLPPNLFSKTPYISKLLSRCTINDPWDMIYILPSLWEQTYQKH